MPLLKPLGAHPLPAIACRRLFVAAVAASLACLISAILPAQSPAVRGYVTSIHPPNGFDVNGERITMTAATRFAPSGSKNPGGDGLTPDPIHLGAWVEVYGERDRRAKTITAHTVEVRDDQDHKLNALAVIERVFSTAPELVFAADGYRLRVTQMTDLKLPHDVKSAADVRPGMWVLYEGKLGQDGLVNVTRAHLLTTWQAKAKSPPASGNSAPSTASAEPPGEAPRPEIEIDDQRTEIDLHDINWQFSKDKALQQRVRRIGMKLVPAYQFQLADDDPAKIHFEFIAVKNPMRDEETSAEGLILVPAGLIARFKNDDQLAAVMADGIAYCLQQAMPFVIQANRSSLEWGAAMGAANLVPFAGLAVGGVYQFEIEKALREQRWRVALELMDDAGYDPWQSPEAWRLAAPGKLPADTNTLKYPDRSGYQLGILNLMYRKPTAARTGDSSSPANPNTSAAP